MPLILKGSGLLAQPMIKEMAPHKVGYDVIIQKLTSFKTIFEKIASQMKTLSSSENKLTNLCSILSGYPQAIGHLINQIEETVKLTDYH